MVLPVPVWRVHLGDSDTRQNRAFSARAGPQNPNGMGNRVPPLMICFVTLNKFLPFSGLTSTRKEIRKRFM